jgi:AcrR family transcriptional regulator
MSSSRPRSTATAPLTDAPPRGRARAPSKRAQRAEERRGAIVTAAFDEFVARGFAATRLDDVARRAGVAKGTIYLYFADKEALFQELVRTALVPLIEQLARPPQPGGSARAMLEHFAETFVREVAGTRRGEILRLIIAEGARFPALSEFYYREVVERGLQGLRALIDYGIARGEIRNDDLSRYPQLVVAPAIVSIIWQGLFARYATLDVPAMLRAHLDLIFGPRSSP